MNYVSFKLDSTVWAYNTSTKEWERHVVTNHVEYDVPKHGAYAHAQHEITPMMKESFGEEWYDYSVILISDPVYKFIAGCNYDRTEH